MKTQQRGRHPFQRARALNCFCSGLAGGTVVGFAGHDGLVTIGKEGKREGERKKEREKEREKNSMVV